MESDQIEDSKSSSGETDRQEHVKDDASTGRFYECTFCKQGFSTAQALGGHMNIHRRDRAIIRHRMLSSGMNKLDNDASNSGFFSQFQNYPQFHSPENMKSYPMYFRPSASGNRETYVFHSNNSPVRKPGQGPQLNPFGEELHVGPGTQVDREEKGRDEMDGELDLELRLEPEP
ncbi:uncharacterized protein LOC143880695 [Tasmannia lanceolata]|uniref:uncharacterized protein LOC143880695 n=1 Tax=Tasmannia lanceolata TaxID=3420 RepID=UPI004062DDC7